MKLSREQMLKDLKSIKEPILREISFCDSGGVDFRVLSQDSGHLGGWEDIPIRGPFKLSQEQYEAIIKLKNLGYEKESDYEDDESIYDDEKLEVMYNLLDDFDVAFFMLSKGCVPEQKYFFLIPDLDIKDCRLYAGKEAFEKHLLTFTNSPYDELWDDMMDEVLEEWHDLLQNPKMEQWENWEYLDMSDLLP